MADSVEISVLISCYFEEQSIDEFHDRLSKTLEGMGRSYEILFVNDGSTDATWEKLRAIYEADPRVTAVVDLYRNAGQAAAKTAALEYVRGEMLVFLDSDLELAPEELPRLVAEYDKGCDIVSGYREERSGPLLRRLPSVFANMVMRRVSRHPVRDFGCTFKIYSGTLVRAFEFGPFKPWTAVFVFSRARDVVEVPVSHRPRPYGKSGWTVKKLTAYFFDNLVGISRRPFQLLALLCLVFAGFLFLRVVLSRVLQFTILPTVTTGLLLNAIALHLLVTLAVLATIGEYVIRNFINLQRYPAYVVRTVQRREPAP